MITAKKKSRGEHNFGHAGVRKNFKIDFIVYTELSYIEFWALSEQWNAKGNNCKCTVILGTGSDIDVKFITFKASSFKQVENVIFMH